MENRTLLIVDDEPNVVSSLKRQIRREGYTVYSAQSGRAGLEILDQQDVGVVISDYWMPEMDGITFLESVKNRDPDAVRILLTANSVLDNAIAAINRTQIFGYLPKPWSEEDLKKTIAKAFEQYDSVLEKKRLIELTSQQNTALKHFNANLEGLLAERTVQVEDAVREGIMMLVLAAEAKDDDTGDHLGRIRNHTRKLCEGLGLSPKETEDISFFSMMHDVGKIFIPDGILRKPGSLTADEYAVVKQHSLVGEKILGKKPFYHIARQIARNHHERWDGCGYPDGLKGQDIPLPARIVAVADVFDALISPRPYKDAWPLEKVLSEMKALSAKAFDPDILRVFLDNIERNSVSDSNFGITDVY